MKLTKISVTFVKNSEISQLNKQIIWKHELEKNKSLLVAKMYIGTELTTTFKTIIESAYFINAIDLKDFINQNQKSAAQYVVTIVDNSFVWNAATIKLISSLKLNITV